MRAKLYKKVKDFLDDNDEFLLEKEALTQLILVNAKSNEEKETSEDILFGRIENNLGMVKLIFCSVKPRNLIVYDLDKESYESPEFLAEYLIKEKIDISGINANKKVCDKFIAYYKEIKKCEFKEKLAMDIMELRKPNVDMVYPKGTFREANLSDLDMLIDWEIKFTKEALDEDIKVEDFKEKLTSRIENKQVYLFEDENNIPMSMTVMNRQLKKGISISLVYSSKEGRGKGYGLAVVYNVCKEYLNRGNEFCTLFVDKKNPISNGVYKKIGFEILEDNYDYRIF